MRGCIFEIIVVFPEGIPTAAKMNGNCILSITQKLGYIILWHVEPMPGEFFVNWIIGPLLVICCKRKVEVLTDLSSIDITMEKTKAYNTKRGFANIGC